MKFFTDVKQEYNEMMGESGDDEEDEKPKELDNEEDFQNLMSDIKKDLKKIPKEDVWPVFPDSTKVKEEKSEVVEESEFDIGDAKRALHLGEQKKKQAKKCRVGNKIYDVGDRWTDEGTGKDMICILMNIPKDVQPTLADVDSAFTSDPEKIPVEDTPQWDRPSVEPQWSYTANPSKKQGQIKPIKEKCKPDKEDDKDISDQTNVKVDQSNQFQHQQEDIINKPDDKQTNDNSKEAEDLLPNENEESTRPAEIILEPAKEKKDKPIEMLKTPESDKSESTENTDESMDDNSESDYGSEYEIGDRKPPFKGKFSTKHGPSTKKKDESKEDKPTNEDQINENIYQEEIKENHKSTVHAQYETPELPKDQIETSSDQISTDDKFRLGRTDEIPKKYEDENINTNVNYNMNKSEPSNEDKNTTEQNGKKIFMKETVVKHRKLLRTEETIETINSDKN